MEYSKAMIAKIKMDQNKYRVAGIEVDLFEMLKEGVMEIVGEKNGELVYGLTARGEEQVKSQKVQ